MHDGIARSPHRSKTVELEKNCDGNGKNISSIMQSLRNFLHDAHTTSETAQQQQ
jgi:hypothetical protein